MESEAKMFQSFKDLAIVPVQRFPHYGVLFSGLLSCFGMDKKGYDIVQSTKGQIDECLKDMNRAKEIDASTKLIFDLNRLLTCGVV